MRRSRSLTIALLLFLLLPGCAQHVNPEQPARPMVKIFVDVFEATVPAAQASAVIQQRIADKHRKDLALVATSDQADFLFIVGNGVVSVGPRYDIGLRRTTAVPYVELWIYARGGPNLSEMNEILGKTEEELLAEYKLGVNGLGPQFQYGPFKAVQKVYGDGWGVKYQGRDALKEAVKWLSYFGGRYR